VIHLIERFIQNEWKGLQQIARKLQESFFSNDILRLLLRFPLQPRIELSPENFPKKSQIINAINVKAKVFPTKVEVVGDVVNRLGAADPFAKEIALGKTVLETRANFLGSYTHELGHIKNRNVDRLVAITRIPFKLAFAATSCLYQSGLALHPFIGNNIALDMGNAITQHAGTFLAIGWLVNSITTRISEHRADLFAYKHTGLLPSEYLPSDYRRGLIGNISEILAQTESYIRTGYPTTLERDFVCKILGKKPADMSFVDKILSEQGQQNSVSVAHKK
jgi:hypothetical protein